MRRDLAGRGLAVGPAEAGQEVLGGEGVLLRAHGLHDVRRQRAAHLRGPLEVEIPGQRGQEAGPERVADTGRVRIGFDGKAEFCNPAGFIQGGILTAMLDDTMGPAAFIKTGGRLYTATISMTVNFLAPAPIGPIIGEARVVQIGKTIAFIEGKLMDVRDMVLATASASARLVETARAVKSA